MQINRLMSWRFYRLGTPPGETARIPTALTAAVILRMRYRALGLFHQVSRPLIAMTTVRALASDMTILLGIPSTSPV